MPSNLDTTAKDLLNRILVVDVNQRPSLGQIMKSSFFKETDWDLVRSGDIQNEAPYIPQAGKYNYLFFNSYGETSMIDTSHYNRLKSVKTKILGDFSYTRVQQEMAKF